MKRVLSRVLKRARPSRMFQFVPGAIWPNGVKYALCLWLWVLPIAAAEALFSVASFNVENYLDVAAGTRPAKSLESKAKVQKALLMLQADVVAFQEMGTTNALLELRNDLEAQGLVYSYWDHVTGFDPHISLALLSRFPIVATRPHTNDTFLLAGRRYRVLRGFQEVDIQVNAQYTFTLFNGHLKSRRPVGFADQADLREQEAIILREKIDARLKARPSANLVVLGDFNDTIDSRVLRTILGRGRSALVDTRPSERWENDPAHPASGQRRVIAWTYHFAREDTYSRIDYILLSPGMAREWERPGSYVLRMPDWGEASDHRPLIASFVKKER